MLLPTVDLLSDHINVHTAHRAFAGRRFATRDALERRARLIDERDVVDLAIQILAGHADQSARSRQAAARLARQSSDSRAVSRSIATAISDSTTHAAT